MPRSLPVGRMQRLAEGYMASTAEILTYSSSQDEWGNPRKGWSVASTTTCRLAPGGGGSESVVASRLEASFPAVAYLPHNTSISPENRLRVDGVEYEVHGVETRTEELKPFTKAVISR